MAEHRGSESGTAAEEKEISEAWGDYKRVKIIRLDWKLFT